MRNRIFGTIGILWGGAILILFLLRGGPQGSGAYAAGQYAALAFGTLMVLAGILAVAKQDPNRPKSDSPGGKSSSSPAAVCLLMMILTGIVLWNVDRAYREQLAFLPRQLVWLVGFVIACVIGWIGWEIGAHFQARRDEKT